MGPTLTLKLVNVSAFTRLTESLLHISLFRQPCKIGFTCFLIRNVVIQKQKKKTSEVVKLGSVIFQKMHDIRFMNTLTNVQKVCLILCPTPPTITIECITRDKSVSQPL